MVTNPDDLIPEFLKIGCEYISVHQETCPHLHKTLSGIRENGSKAGVALNPSTPVESINEVLPLLDLIIIMGVNPGFAGQKHIPETADKISRLIVLLRERAWKGMIQVDGGVSPENACRLVLAGADCLVAGASAFRRRNPGELHFDSDYTLQVKANIEDIRHAITVAIEKGIDSR